LEQTHGAQGKSGNAQHSTSNTQLHTVATRGTSFAG
jgi:hypothetical protein